MLPGNRLLTRPPYGSGSERSHDRKTSELIRQEKFLEELDELAAVADGSGFSDGNRRGADRMRSGCNRGGQQAAACERHAFDYGAIDYGATNQRRAGGFLDRCFRADLRRLEPVS